MHIKVANLALDTRCLGPYRRNVLWVSGCCFACPGCIARGMRGGGKEAESAALGELLLAGEAVEGVTISGGEPFLQAGAVAEMLRYMRGKRDMGVILYTGFLLEALRRESEARRLLAEADIVIDGQYARELDRGEAFRGSVNQRVHFLSRRYAEVWREWAARPRETEIRATAEGLSLIGLPAPETRRIWRALGANEEGNHG